MNLELNNFRVFSKYCRIEGKPNLKKEGGKLTYF